MRRVNLPFFFSPPKIEKYKTKTIEIPKTLFSWSPDMRKKKTCAVRKTYDQNVKYKRYIRESGT